MLLCLFLLLGSCAPVPPLPQGRRWVSLSPSTTEVLFALGAGEEVVGVCEPADYPPGAASKPRVASWERTDVERIAALAPTACFTVEGMQSPASLAALERLGIEVDVFPAQSLNDVYACIEAVGTRVGRSLAGRSLADSLRRRVAAARAPVPAARARTIVVVGLDPPVAAGRTSFLSDVLDAAGFENALGASAEAYPSVSLETLAGAAPAWVIFPADEIARDRIEAFHASLEAAEGRPVTLVSIPADLLVRPGPRSVEAVERLAAARRASGGTP